MEEEYRLEEEQAALEHEQYLKASGTSIDENSLAFETADPALLAESKKVFTDNCATCHLNDGGGGQGPNLTDDNWIYGCQPKDIFQSIKYGRPKGMMAWKDNLSDKQILSLMNYVHSLHGIKPAVAKEPQGEFCSAKVTGDSVLAIK